MNLKKTLLHLAAGLCLMSCGDDFIKSAPFKHVEILSMDNLRNLNTIIESPTAHSGKNVCHVDSGQNYGLIYDYLLPDSLVGKQLAISFDTWVKTGKVENNCGILCSITNSKDSVIFWQHMSASEFIHASNEWNSMKNSFAIPLEVTSTPNIKISIIPLNADAKSYYEVDDLIITFNEVVPE
jgi:hypothetical protein